MINAVPFAGLVEELVDGLVARGERHGDQAGKLGAGFVIETGESVEEINCGAAAPDGGGEVLGPERPDELAKGVAAAGVGGVGEDVEEAVHCSCLCGYLTLGRVEGMLGHGRHPHFNRAADAAGGKACL